MSEHNLQVRLRPASTTDIPALSTMVLTSFRQFRLVERFYRPLASDRDAARDTMWYWHRRLRLTMLNPTKQLVVAEAVSSDKAADLLAERRQTHELAAGGEDRVTAESWRMLDWSSRFLTTEEPSRVASGPDGKPRFVLGFAIWMLRDPATATATSQPPRSVTDKRRIGWLEWAETLLIKLELWAWGLVYQRKDQDPADHPIYDAAEEELARNHYSTEPCYYLDNLTVDFRVHRLGIGHQLLTDGLEEASNLGLDVSTESSEQGLPLYRKAGFEQVGIWQIEDIAMPVMRWTNKTAQATAQA